MEFKLLGHNYTTPDLVAKVTGKAKYAEDYRAEGMVFIKLMPSPRPHAKIRSIDASAALAMPGVHGILTAKDLPAPPPPPGPPPAGAAAARPSGAPAGAAPVRRRPGCDACRQRTPLRRPPRLAGWRRARCCRPGCRRRARCRGRAPRAADAARVRADGRTGLRRRTDSRDRRRQRRARVRSDREDRHRLRAAAVRDRSARGHAPRIAERPRRRATSSSARA